MISFKSAFCLLLISCALTSVAQVSTHTAMVNPGDEHQIRWIGQYPDPAQKKKSPGILKKVSRFVFGGKDPKVSRPVAVLAYNPDSIWLLDQGNGVIFSVIGKVGEIPSFHEKKPVEFTSLVGICPLKGDILFTESKLNKIYRFTPGHKDLRLLNESLNLEQPTGIAWSKANHEIWVIETSAHRIAILDEDGKLKRTLGQRGTGNGQFNFPSFIWIDKDDNKYIVDALNYRVQIFNHQNEFVSTFGKAGDASGYFARPKGVAVDSEGNIYVVDALFHNVQIFNKKGEFLYQFGSQGREKEQFWMPSGIFIDEKDYIYVADCYNSRIQIFQYINRN